MLMYHSDARVLMYHVRVRVLMYHADAELLVYRFAALHAQEQPDTCSTSLQAEAIHIYWLA